MVTAGVVFPDPVFSLLLCILLTLLIFGVEHALHSYHRPGKR